MGACMFHPRLKLLLTRCSITHAFISKYQSFNLLNNLTNDSGVYEDLLDPHGTCLSLLAAGTNVKRLHQSKQPLTLRVMPRLSYENGRGYKECKPSRVTSQLTWGLSCGRYYLDRADPRRRNTLVQLRFSLGERLYGSHKFWGLKSITLC